MGKDPAEVRKEIEQTRGEMEETVDALGYKADVKGRVSGYVSEKKDAIVGGVHFFDDDPPPIVGDPGSFALVDLGSAVFNETLQVFGGRFAATAPIQFSLSPDVVSFALLSDLAATGRFGAFGEFVDPSGRNLVAARSIDE